MLYPVHSTHTAVAFSIALLYSINYDDIYDNILQRKLEVTMTMCFLSLSFIGIRFLEHLYLFGGFKK